MSTSERTAMPGYSRNPQIVDPILLERHAIAKDMKINLIVPLAGVPGFLAPRFGQPTSPLTPLHTITLPNVQGGFNHMSVDPGHQRLFPAPPTHPTTRVPHPQH